MGMAQGRQTQRNSDGGKGKEGGGYLLRFYSKFQSVIFLRQFRIGACEVLDLLLMVAFRFCEVGDFGGEVFDAGG